MSTWKKEVLVDNFLVYLGSVRNFSKYTIRSYQLDLTDFFSFVKKNQIDYLNITKDDIRAYLKYLDEKKLKSSSISRKISTLRTFYNYLLNENIISNNLFKYIRNPKIDKKIPAYLNYSEIEELLESIDLSTKSGIRNRLLLEVFYATGARVSEVINIKHSDIDKYNKCIRIKGKGSKERIVYYGDYVVKYMELYNSDSEYLFVNDKGDKLSVFEVEKIIENIMKQISIKTHVTPHTLRHTFATHLLNNGADIKSVQELLGHANLSTTGIYTHVSTDRLKDTYFKLFKR